jgi:hypothetical protein
MAAPRYSAQDFADAFTADGIEVEPEYPKGSNDNTKQRRSGRREQPDPVCTVDRDDYVARCTELLKGYASSPREFDSNGKQVNGPAVQSVKDKPDTTGGGDEWTCQVARNMGDEGISEAKCYELMKTVFNPACVPPWKIDGEEGQYKDRLRTKIANAYASRQEPIGSKTGEGYASDFDNTDTDADAGADADTDTDTDADADADAKAKAKADAKSKPGENPKAKLKISATPFVPVDPRSIAPRDWLYGLHYIRKYIVADVSPGGGGKTSNVLVEAISMATGVDLLRVGRMYPRPLRVWYWNGEDPREEVERRVAAICKFYSEPDPDFPDDPPLLNAAALARLRENLFLDTGRSTPIKIATPEGLHGTTKIAQPLVEALIEEVCAKGIDVLVIDPFVSSHSVSENDNVSIDRVIKEGWVPVAERGNCCVDLVHHTRKTGKGAELGAADARGASAIVDAARNVRVFNIMTDDEAATYKMPKEYRWRFFRVDADKTNMAARGAASPWRSLESVSLDNGRDGFPADSVGVVTAWDPPKADPLATAITNDKILKAALDLFNQGKRVTKTHGNNSIKKMVPAFRKLTGMDKINAHDIAAAYEAAVNATPATWCYQDSNKAQHVAAGYVPMPV